MEQNQVVERLMEKLGKVTPDGKCDVTSTGKDQFSMIKDMLNTLLAPLSHGEEWYGIKETESTDEAVPYTVRIPKAIHDYLKIRVRTKEKIEE
jgi:hypothetical protein